MALSGAQVTQLRPGAPIGRPYGSFAGKESADRPKVTQFRPGYVIGRPYGDFSGKRVGGIAAGAGSVVGTSTVTGVSASTSDAVGAITGTSTVVGAGASLVEAVGSVVGTSTVVGTSEGTSDATGAAAGTSAVAGAGASIVEAVGSIAGTSAVAAEGVQIVGADGAVAGTSTVSGVGEVSPFWMATGSIAGQAEVLASGDAIQPPPPPPDAAIIIPEPMRPALPQAPIEYDPGWGNHLVQALEIALSQLEDYRKVQMTGMALRGFPDNGAALNVGEVFINENGVLQVVRPGDIFVGNASIVTELGSVTVLTP